MKFGTLANSNVMNSMMINTITILDGNYLSWTNLVQKCKIFCLSGKLVPRHIQIRKIYFFRLEIISWANLVRKFKTI